MKKLITILAICAACLTAHAQTAKVIALSKEDAAKAKALYEEKARIEAEIAHVNQKIEDTYTKRQVEGRVCDMNCKDVLYSPWLTGWEGGFEYSDDYRFIVPKVVTGPVQRLPYELGKFTGTCANGQCISW